MRRRSRVRRVLKWMGLALCILTTAAWALSVRWCVGLYVGKGENATLLWYGNGRLAYNRWEWVPLQWAHRTSDWVFDDASNRRGTELQQARNEQPGPLSSSALGLGLPHCWRAGGFLPLWVLLAAFGVPTLFLWWRDRRYPKGHCQDCGYDLTGNVSGICPECGKAPYNMAALDCVELDHATRRRKFN